MMTVMTSEVINPSLARKKNRIRAEELLLSVIRREKHPEIRRAEKLIKGRRKSLWSRWKRK